MTCNKSVLDGEIVTINNQLEFDNILEDDRYSSPSYKEGIFIGPGKYLYMIYDVPCSRGCCYDIVHELFSPDEVLFSCKNEISKLKEKIQKIEAIQDEFKGA